LYSIEFSKAASKSFASLPREVQKRIVGVLDRVKIRPKKFFVKLTDNSYYKLRAGDYRIIADISESELLVLVIEVGHRKKIYKKT